MKNVKLINKSKIFVNFINMVIFLNIFDLFKIYLKFKKTRYKSHICRYNILREV